MNKRSVKKISHCPHLSQIYFVTGPIMSISLDYEISNKIKLLVTCLIIVHYALSLFFYRFGTEFAYINIVFSNTPHIRID